jgi:uracil-DNA glycosylase
MEDIANKYEQLLGHSWYEQLEHYILSNDFLKLRDYIISRCNRTAVYPDADMAFKAFKTCPYNKVKVVIFGQDPYPDGTATGIAFSTNGKLNPSIREILKAMQEDLGTQHYRSTNLDDLAYQGVLLVNAALTVEHGKPGSHLEVWRNFTNAVVSSLLQKETLVWMLWGKSANELVKEVPSKHLLLSTVHPAAVSYNEGLKFYPEFAQCNTYLKSKGLEEINWFYEDDLPF